MQTPTICELVEQQVTNVEKRVRFIGILLGKDAHKYMSKLTKPEKNLLKGIITQWLDIWFANQLYLQRLYATLDESNQNETTYDFNQKNIQAYIRKYVTSNGSIPNVQTIANALKLDRKTVRRHLDNNKNGPTELLEKLDTLTTDLVGNLAGIALRDNNVKAAKVCLDTMEKLKKNNAKPAQVQLNNHVITLQMLEELRPEQQAYIVEMIKERNEPSEEVVETEAIVIEDTQEQTAIETTEEVQPELNAAEQVPPTDTVPEDTLPKEEPTVKFDPVKVSKGGGTLFE
ncbi:MAG TPA: hypothetical protein VK154_06375 [Chitinophagales bacterium]|nr:hypothetical protein [Chitinophagales bacterium]